VVLLKKQYPTSWWIKLLARFLVFWDYVKDYNTCRRQKPDAGVLASALLFGALILCPAVPLLYGISYKMHDYYRFYDLQFGLALVGGLYFFGGILLMLGEWLAEICSAIAKGRKNNKQTRKF